MYRDEHQKFVEPPLRGLKEEKADPFPPTLRGLIGWLKTKPADKEYCYTDFGNCLYAQFAQENGYWNAKHRSYVGCGCPGAGANVANTRPWTFGAALKRAQAAIGRLS